MLEGIVRSSPRWPCRRNQADAGWTIRYVLAQTGCEPGTQRLRVRILSPYEMTQEVEKPAADQTFPSTALVILRIEATKDFVT